MAQSSHSERSPLGIASVLIPPALIVLFLVGKSFPSQSVASRLLVVVALFVLGVGTGLGVGGLMRRGNGSPKRFSAVLGIVLNGLMFLVLALSAAGTPAPAAQANIDRPAPDSSRASDR